MEGFGGKFLSNCADRRHALHPQASFSSSSSPCDIDPIDEGAEPHIPVLIVGAGPVGLYLAYLFTKLGVDCAILEKSTAFSQHPQAHFINNRSMELLRKIDGLAKDIQELQPPVDLWRKFIYCTSLSGSILGSVDQMQPQDFEKEVSPESVAHYSHYKLVRLLLRKLESLGFESCTPDGLRNLGHHILQEKRIFMGLECTSIRPTVEGVKVGASFIKEGKLEEMNFHCSFLIGSDGARSTVRKLLGIKMQGEHDLQKFVSVHFFSKDFGQYLLHERPGMLFFILNPEAISLLVAHDLNEGEFVLQVPYYPPQQNFKDFSSKVSKKIIFKLVGWKLEDLKIKDIKQWVMHAEVADKYVSCNDRVILVGDAAHRFPPAGGFGMNTGIQDAHNLAWKICLLLRNVSSPSIIESYEIERRPIAISNATLSMENLKLVMSIPAALGVDPAVAKSVHRGMNSTFGSILPCCVQKFALEGIFSLARAQLSPLLLNESNPIGSLRLARLKKIFDDGKSLQLLFPAQDLGFRYLEGALVAQSNDEILEAGVHSFKPRSKNYVASSKSGSRLPHMQIKALTASLSEDVFSTLDLVPVDKVEFLLIIAPVKESYDLGRTAFKVVAMCNVSLKVCIIWPYGSSGRTSSGSSTEFEPLSNYIDVEEVKMPSSGSWWEMCHLSSNGVMLVRPDEHIAWSTETNNMKDYACELKKAFSLILGRSQ